MNTFLIDQLKEAAAVLEQLASHTEIHSAVYQASQACVTALQSQKKIIFVGNGGSAADAQHFAAELVGKFYFDRPAMTAISLTTDTSMLTAIGNDYGFEKVFSRQLEAQARAGDVLVCLSTSGNSGNVVEAIRFARTQKVYTVGLTGRKGGLMKELCDVCVCVPSDSTPRIQEAHTVLGHALCAAIERELHAN